ncbi:MAG: glycosyltransferase, partial [Candidatus Promineifilaceae bacterium]|nr:glycosyltransferase [Candidatus Promineifilaceae bacterium]
LARRGIQVDVFTRSQDDCVPAISHDLGHGARVVHVPAGPQEPIPVADITQYLDEFAQNVLQITRNEGLQYDLIHSHYWLSGLVAEKLQQAWKHPPIVHMFHTLGHMKNRIAGDNGERASNERIEGEQHVLKIAQQIVVATPAELAQLHWLYGARSGREIVIPPGVDLERFYPIPKEDAKNKVGIPQNHKNIMFVGRIEPLKGIDTLLQAMALISARFPDVVENVCVGIIGGDPWTDDLDEEMARLHDLRKELDIHDFVTFLGAKDQNTLPYYYGAAEMVIMPSHYESFGMVALEAMATGTPVIASEVGGLAFLIRDGENGFHVPSRDPEALAERIYELLTNSDCRDSLGQQALQDAKQYAWPIIVSRMLSAYQKLSI